MPIIKVTMASSRKSQRHPPQPATPLICSTPAAMKDPTMLTVLSAVQNQDSLMGSSFDL